MKALKNREWLILPAMFLAVHLMLFLESVSFGASSEDIHRWEKSKDVESLIPALGDKYSDVREAAAKALENLGEPLGRLIVQSLEGSEKAREALAAGKDPRAIVPLINVLATWDPNVRAAAAKTLGKLKDPRAVESLVKALEDRSDSVQEAAVWALGEIEDPLAVVPVVKALGDGRPNVRMVAAWVLGKFADGRAVDPLLKTMGNEDAKAREAASQVLDKL